MTKIDFNSSLKSPKILKPGEALCLSCGRFLSYCGRPFSGEIRCPACGTINVYEESQHPSGIKATQT